MAGPTRMWVALMTLPVLVVAACSGDDSPKRAPDRLSPTLRGGIRDLMSQSISPTFTSIWQLSDRGDLTRVPALARQLKQDAGQAAALLQSTPHPPPDMVVYLERLAVQADSIAASGAAGDLPGVAALTSRMQQTTCDACHTRHLLPSGP